MLTLPLVIQRSAGACHWLETGWRFSLILMSVASCGQPPDGQRPELELAAPPALTATTPGHNSLVLPAAPHEARATPPSAGPSVDVATPAPPTPAKPPGNTVAETRTTEAIAQVVLANRQSVRDCYERELKRDPKLRGRLTIAFTIDPQGRVEEAHLNPERSTLTRPALVACATVAVKAMRFPPSSRGFESTVNYPFDLRP